MSPDRIIWNGRPSRSLQDLIKTSEAEARTAPIENKMIELSATIDEILDWYYSKDPLNELEYLNPPNTGDLYEDLVAHTMSRQQDAELLGYAATNLLMRLGYPEFYEAERPPMDMLGAAVAQTMPDAYDAESGFFSMHAAIERCTLNLVRELSAEEVELMLEAAYMLVRSATFDSSAYERIQEARTAGRQIDIGSLIAELKKSEPSNSQLLYRELAQAILMLVASQAENDYDKQPSYESARAALCAMQLYSLGFLGTIDGERSFSEDRVKMLNVLVTGAERFFTGDNCLQKMLPGDPRVRGLLHEHMWHLDFSLLLNALENPLIHVGPSLSSENAPKVNYPEANRGIDFRVNVLGGPQGVYGYGIQLKSRPNPRAKKEYHPMIRVVHERSLHEITPRNMAIKLNNYKKFLDKALADGRFSEGIEPVKRQMLQSVKDEYDFIYSPAVVDRIPGLQEHINSLIAEVNSIVMGGAGLNRQHRRAQRRAQRKKGR